ncbi:DNA repair rhp54 [Fusarium beomiforme]|uniref:DNA repair rhp54 n=1 Tax=Fusarium beomiforme TaxID=44412 RepID=A0A9P5DY40_9HYPO|nr:DNA repair rhp54 [Fusarium beomiforme]
MDGIEDDPYSWDVGVVVNRLCAPGVPWTRDPAFLATRIQEEEFDGKTLLTFEHVCSRQELMDCLGIRIARHKAALVEAIVTLRSKSKGYWQWQADFKRKQSGYPDEENEALTHHATEQHDRHHGNAPGPVSATNGTLPPSTKDSPQEPAIENHAHPPQEDGQLHLVTPSHLPPVHKPPDRAAEVDERSSKRRRVAPMLLTNKPTYLDPAFLPTEVDVLDYTTNKVVPELADYASEGFPWENAPAYAYLGNGRIPREDILTPRGRLSSFIEESEDSFTVVSSHRIPPARRLVVNNTFRRLFTGRYRISTRSSRSPSYLSNESDKILELADLDNELDAETLREMKDEELENERLDALQDDTGPYPFVTPERIAEILNESITAIEANWMEKKLPKYEQKAYSLWQKSRRLGIKNIQIQNAYKTAKHLIERIRKLCLEIQKIDSASESHYREAAKSLEQSLEDKMYQKWLIKSLESSRPPAKPQTVARPKPRAVRQSDTLALVEEEILTSSDEDFIVPNNPMDVIENGLTNDRNSPACSVKEDWGDVEAEFVDLTQEDMEEPLGLGSHLTNPIDLTSSAKKAKEYLPRLSQEEAFRPRKSLFERDIPKVGTCKEAITQGDNRKTENPVNLDSRLTEPDLGDWEAPINPASEKDHTENRSEEIHPERSQPSRHDDSFQPPPIENFGDLQQLASQSLKTYVKRSDRWRLLIGEMWQMEHDRRKSAIDLILSDHPNIVWEEHIQPYLSSPLKGPQQLLEDSTKAIIFDVVRLCRCFFVCQHTTEEQMFSYKVGKLRKTLNQARVKFFEPFCMFVGALTPHFPQDSQIYRHDTDILDGFFPEEKDELEDFDGSLGEGHVGRRRPKHKEIIRDKAAVDLRERENQRLREQEARRKKLRETLALDCSVSRDGTRLIINESKEEDQSLIYIHEDIGRRIKDHQIDGVRFIWNQIVRDPSVRQGCLLAHTMGLGKTMQVITVLVALAEAAQSKDPSVVAQIPEDLRDPRILVLCPAALVDNWMDELLKWAPVNLLGELRKISANMTPEERAAAVSAWASGRGILTVGYEMFKKILDMSEELADLVTNRPDVVVADEAHNLKNRDTKTHMACSRFKTNSRIALTGSPLSNSVLEYFAMIDWVAPNFLGPYSEFREIYATPVERGLYHDSTSSEKRRAQMKLKALEQLVAPKVNRRTITALKNELPPKQEFIIFVPPTTPQKRLYQLYIQGVAKEGTDSQTETFAAINHLGLICSHPRCFEAKVKSIEKGTRPNSDDDEKKTDKSFPKSMIPEFLKTLHSFRDLNTPTLSLKTELLTIILDEARKVNDKVLIFSQSLLTLNYIENMCRMQRRTVCRLDGNTPVASRQKQTKDFNEGSKEVFLISTTAGGVGLNIQGANRVVIFDVRYNPSHEQQAVGRAYRIGQQKPVFVYRFMVAGTFEDNLHNRQVFKMQLASRVVDKKNPISWSKRKGDVVSEIRDRPPSDLRPYLGKDKILDQLIKHRENGEGIRSIVTTDTFEEEDLGAALTEDEKKQVAEMIRLNHLRVTNPEEYLRARDRVDIMEQARMHREQDRLLHASSLSQQPVPRSIDGTSEMFLPAQPPSKATAPDHGQDLPAARKLSHEAGTSLVSQQPTTSTHGTAPMPMAGANTFFGENNHSGPVAEPHSAPAVSTQQQLSVPTQSSQEPPWTASPRTFSARPPNITPWTNTPSSNSPDQEPMSTQSPANQARLSPIFKQGGVFNVTENPAMVEFENRLRGSLQKVQQRNVLQTAGDPAEKAKSITMRVNQVRKKGRLLSHEKWVIAIVTGFVAPEYLAEAEEKVLEKRIEIINALKEAEIPARALEKANSPDPNNLQNIRRRNSHQGEKRTRTTDDIKVMREAMDNRRNRAFRLPPWANEALYDEKNRGSPTMGTRQGQFGFTDDTPGY